MHAHAHDHTHIPNAHNVCGAHTLHLYSTDSPMAAKSAVVDAIFQAVHFQVTVLPLPTQNKDARTTHTQPTHTHTRAHARTQSHTHTHTRNHIRTHTHTQTHIHTCTHKHTHAHTCAHVSNVLQASSRPPRTRV